MKVSKRDLQILMAFGGIILAFCSYYFIYKDLKPQTDDFLQKNRALETQIARLEALDVQKEQYIKDTGQMLADTERVIGTYAYGLSREDEIMYLTQLESENSLNMTIQNLNMSTPEEVPYIQEVEALPGTEATPVPGTTAAPAGTTPAAVPVSNADNDYAEPVIEDDGIKLYKEAINYNFTTTYAGFKNILDSIYHMGSHKSIDNISLSFDTESGNLSASMQLCLYYLEGTGKPYQPLSITRMATGVDNVFRTVDVMPTKGGSEEDSAETASE